MYYLIEQTNYCNLECVGCPNRLHLRPRGTMTPFMFEGICDQIVVHGNKRLRTVLHGTGEPLLSSHLWRNLDYLDRLGFDNVDFTTNGMLLTEEKSREIVKHKCLSWFRISLNSSQPELMEQINTGASFEQTVENAGAFLRIWAEAGRSFRAVVQLMRTKANLDESKEDIYELLGRRDFDATVKDYNTFAGLTQDNELAILKGPGFDNCFYGRDCYYIHWDGDIVGCCMDPTKWQICGNVSDGIFSEKVSRRRSELAAAQRRGDYSELPFCKQCEGST